MKIARVLFVTFSLLLSVAAARAEDAAHVEQPSPPTSAWLAAASKHDVDLEILYAIALKESRRPRPDGQVRPWPWTLHTPEDQALYFDDQASAASKLRELIAAGNTNVDVGVMQVSYRFNGHRVTRPEELLVPAINIDVAAQILREHLNELNGDVRLAIARYHSPQLQRGITYSDSVLKIVDQLRRIEGLRIALAR